MICKLLHHAVEDQCLLMHGIAGQATTQVLKAPHALNIHQPPACMAIIPFGESCTPDHLHTVFILPDPIFEVVSGEHAASEAYRTSLMTGPDVL